MTDDLKPCPLTGIAPCPFCGGKATAWNLTIEGAVHCESCRATIVRPHQGIHDTGYEDAIAAWNTRTKTKAEQAFDQQIADYVKRGKP